MTPEEVEALRARLERMLSLNSNGAERLRDDTLAALREQAGEIAQLRELLNLYNLGGWTDAERLMKERDALRAENESLRKDAEEWRKLQAFHESMAMAAGLPEPNP